MKRVTVRIHDKCHYTMKLFCDECDISHQEFYVKAQAHYLQTHCDASNVPECKHCMDMDARPSAVFDYPLE